MGDLAESLINKGFQRKIATMQHRQGFEKNIGNISDCQNAVQKLSTPNAQPALWNENQ